MFGWFVEAAKIQAQQPAQILSNEAWDMSSLEPFLRMVDILA